MSHDTALIFTIAAAVALALLFGLIATRFRLPPLVGYLVAGIVVGPFTPGFVADTGLAQQISEIGVILLMFGVGIHFSPGDLLAVRRLALPGAVVQVTVVAALGTLVARVWGWALGSSLVFGLCLSVASTVVVLRSLEDRRALDSADGRVAVGWLVLQDVFMVLVLVLLPALAPALGGQSLDGGTPGLVSSLLTIVAKLVAFMVVMFVVARRAVPWLLERVALTGSRELFTLAVLAIALGIAVGAAVLFDISFALGAFFAGVVVNGSDLSHEAAADALPLQDAFSVLFFVAVGMLFDPAIIIQMPLQLVSTVMIAMLGNSIAVFMIVMLLRFPLATALTVSASLAQIGEFSFILAGLGVSLGLISTSVQSLIVAAALLSISLNPLAFAISTRMGRLMEGSPRMLALFDRSGRGRAVTPPPKAGMRDHVVIIGFGKVGSAIGHALSQRSVPYVALEQDYERVQAVRARGLPVLFGDGSRRGVLEQVDIATARLLVITAPEPFKARAIIKAAREINPAIDTVVRTHSDDEKAYLEQINVGKAVMGERELANAMTEYALARCDPSPGSSDS